MTAIYSDTSKPKSPSIPLSVTHSVYMVLDSQYDLSDETGSIACSFVFDMIQMLGWMRPPWWAGERPGRFYVCQSPRN